MTASTPLPAILVVDDTPENIMVLEGILRDRYIVYAALDGERALKIAAGPNPPDLILLDIMMPGMSGFEVCRELKSSGITQDIPVIFVTAVSDPETEAAGFELGAVDYIIKPVSPPIVLARVKTHLRLHDQNRALEAQVRDRTEELTETRLEVIRYLGRAAEFRDYETGMHIVRMSHYCREIALEAGLSEDAAELIWNASPLHDVGKIGVPDAVLNKPGPLSAQEWIIMRRHTEIGATITAGSNSTLLRCARLIALTHHERWDGRGYPRGLAGLDIPIEGRIAAIADVFDALTSRRPYKEAWPLEEAVEAIRTGAGVQFDPELVECFLRALPKIMEFRDQYADPAMPDHRHTTVLPMLHPLDISTSRTGVS